MIKRSKYRNKKVVDASGQKFDSRREHKRWQELKLMQIAGEISGLQSQVAYELIPTQRLKSGKAERAVKYIADFVYQKDGKTVVEDSKGVRTDAYIIKRKMMLHIHGIEIKEV